MATARKKKTTARKTVRKAKVTRARPKAASRTHRGGPSIQGLLSLLGFGKKMDPKAVGVTVGAVVAAMVVGYGIYQSRTTTGSDGAVVAVKAPTGNLPYKNSFTAQVGAKRGDRIAFWSGEILKGKMTVNGMSRLVEGVAISDNAPLVPKDFNCTTYVETVAAFAKSDRPEDFASKLTSIRYSGGEFTFAHRNHFPEVDWIPNNVRAGNLTDITAQVAQASGVTAKTETKEIRRHEWLATLTKGNKVSRNLASAAEKKWPATAKAEVKYIELGSLSKVMSHIPNGTVINIVHQDAARKPVLISHQGFVIQENGKTYMRHSSTQGDVKQAPLDEYIAKLSKSQEKKSSWPLIGFNLNQIN